MSSSSSKVKSASPRDAAPSYRSKDKHSKSSAVKSGGSSKSSSGHSTKSASKPSQRKAEPKQAIKAKSKSEKTAQAAPADTKLERKAGEGRLSASRKSSSRPSSSQTSSKSSYSRTAFARNAAGVSSLKSSATSQDKQTSKASDKKRSSNKATGKAPSNRTETNGSAFKRFYVKYLKVALPVTILIVLLLGFGIFDFFSGIGKIHPGVKVDGIEVGGMSVEDAASVLEEELPSHYTDSQIVIYTTEDAANADGVYFTDESGESIAYADEVDSDSSSDTDSESDSEDESDTYSDKWVLTPSEIGTYVDGQAIAEDAYKVGRDGLQILTHIKAWLGMIDVDPTLSFDEELFTTLVNGINGTIGVLMVDSDVQIENGVATAVEGSDGWLTDTDLLTQRLSYAALNQETPNFVAPMATVPQNIKLATAQQVCDQVNEALSKQITVTYSDQSWTLDAETYGSFIHTQVLAPEQMIVIGSGTESVDEVSEDNQPVYDVSADTDADSGWILQPYVKQEDVDSWLVSILGDYAGGGATDAYFEASGDTVTIVPSQNGIGPDRAAAALTIQNIAFGEEESTTIPLEDTVIEPSLTTEDAEAMGITEKLAGWKIPLSGSDSRINNITLLCSMINNNIVAPGDTWSFNKTTGERTEEKGFETAPVIVGGKHVDQLGGGICQVATCVYNAACYSGVGIVTRSNHSTYISAYDDYGFADATVSWDTPDLAWKNDYDTYILIKAWCDSDNVYVTFYGTKDGREVTCDRGEWLEGDKYTTVYETDDSLAAGTQQVTQSGVNGRTIYIQYTVVKDGVTLHDVNFHSIYTAQNEIISVGPGTSVPSTSTDSSGT